MKSDDLQEIARYSELVQAELVVNVLRDNGIAAVSSGGASNVALSYFQAGLGAIRVYVGAKDVDAAKKIIEELNDRSGDSWYCGRCKTDVEPGFNVCWSCGQSREDVEAPFPAKLEESIGTPPPNPFLSQSGKANDDDDAFESTYQRLADDMVQRAWIAAILGWCFLPIIMQFVSMYLLIRSLLMGVKLSERTQKRFNVTIILNLVGVAVFAIIIRQIILSVSL